MADTVQAAANRPYQNNQDYLADALKKIQLRLNLAVLKQRAQQRELEDTNLVSNELLHELYLDSAESLQPHASANKLVALEKTIAQLDAQMEARLVLSREQNVFIPMDMLRYLFNLSPLEMDVLLVFLAPYIEERYQKLYGYLTTAKAYPNLSVQLLVHILAQNYQQRAYITTCLSNEAPLLKWQLLNYADNASSGITLASAFNLDLSIANFLLEVINTSSSQQDYWTVIPSDGQIASLSLDEALKSQLQQLLANLKAGLTEYKTNFVYFYGPDPSVMVQTMAALATSLSAKPAKIDAHYLLDIIQACRYDTQQARQRIRRLIRELLLNNYCLLITSAELLYEDETKVFYVEQLLFKELSAAFKIIFLQAKRLHRLNLSDIANGEKALHVLSLEFPLPDFALRRQLWERALTRYQLASVSSEASHLANTFVLTQSQIDAITQTIAAQNLTEPTAIIANILAACNTQNQDDLHEFAKPQKRKLSLADIVLTQATQAQLLEICQRKQYQRQIFHHWGFAAKNSVRDGLCALFYGPSGTGKTSAATVIANELNLQLYVIDVAVMLSKYIGETEKNFAKLFDVAESSNAILFFDEADALFGKRSEVKDAHDRYANVQTSYLLQRIETYRGIIILASNMLNNIDEAFMRRIQFLVEFPMPNEQLRQQIWQQAFPKDAPLASDFDYRFLAKKLKLAGGNISNIALRAAFQAADTGQISMQHIMQAAQQEYAKLGKPFIDRKSVV